jgi:hypothetical protein
MLLRLAWTLACAAGMLQACDCIDLGGRKFRRGADVVFLGTVSEFRDSAKGDRLAVFSVKRVWKRPVTETFEMQAFESGYACFGFWPGVLKLGNELLVFASTFGSDKRQDHPFLSMPCATRLVKDARDVQQLGHGRKPKSR